MHAATTPLPRALAHIGRALALVATLWTASCGEGTPADPPRGARSQFDAPAADAAPAEAPLAIPEDAPTVLFMGDSIGAGLHLAAHQAFPAVLQRRLAGAGLPFHLVNASESGRTTAGGASALAWSLRSDPDVVVIELGGNDGLRNVPVPQVEANLERMLAEAAAAGARVLLLGVRLPPNYGSYGAEFDAVYPRLAERHGVAFVPFFMAGVGGVPELNLPDGLHPTAAGHERLADNVEASLRALLLELQAE
jgi:acyl-CoA thioesterase-1